jgi:hypothetical protein
MPATARTGRPHAEPIETRMTPEPSASLWELVMTAVRLHAPRGSIDKGNDFPGMPRLIVNNTAARGTVARSNIV